MGKIDDRRNRVLGDLDDSSRQISNATRYINFGLLAVPYVLLSSDNELAARVLDSLFWLVAIVGALGVLGVVFDLLHYSAMSKAANQALENDTDGHEYEYRKDWPAHKQWLAFYRWKICCAIAGGAALILLVALTFFCVA